MSFDRTYYQCPICGKGCEGAIAFSKHYEECKKKNDSKVQRSVYVGGKRPRARRQDDRRKED